MVDGGDPISSAGPPVSIELLREELRQSEQHLEYWQKEERKLRKEKFKSKNRSATAPTGAEPRQQDVPTSVAATGGAHEERAETEEACLLADVQSACERLRLEPDVMRRFVVSLGEEAPNPFVAQLHAVANKLRPCEVDTELDVGSVSSDDEELDAEINELLRAKSLLEDTGPDDQSASSRPSTATTASFWTAMDRIDAARPSACSTARSFRTAMESYAGSSSHQVPSSSEASRCNSPGPSPRPSDSAAIGLTGIAAQSLSEANTSLDRECSEAQGSDIGHGGSVSQGGDTTHAPSAASGVALKRADAPIDAGNKSAPAQPRKGGKAKGQGKGPKAPAPPPAGAKGKAGGKGAGQGAGQKPAPTSSLLCLHWKVQRPENVAGYGDQYLAKIKELEDVEEASPGFEGQRKDMSRIQIPRGFDTFFSPACGEQPVPPREFLERYFEKFQGQSVWKQQLEASARDTAGSATEQRSVMLDEKKLQMLGVMMKKFLMDHKFDAGGGDAMRAPGPCQCSNCVAVYPQAQRMFAASPIVGLREIQATLAIKRAVLRCDFDVLRIEALSIIRTVLKQHEKVGQIRQFVTEQGELALTRLCHPELHSLVYQLSKIPQIDERLECIIFSITYQDSLEICKLNLATLRKALQMLRRKQEHIRRFFQTAYTLGQSLNQQSKAASSLQAPRGFQLSTLDKLTETKSTKFPQFSLLHFVLALMDQEDTKELFDAGDIEILQSASALKTDKVIQDAKELTKAFYGVQQMFGETGKYMCPVTGNEVTIEKRRKSTSAHCLKPVEDEFDADDHFHEVMENFVKTNCDSAEDISERAFNEIMDYKDLAIYLNDLKSVYPPPRNNRDPREDLLDIFARFAKRIRSHREDVEHKQLRNLILEGEDKTPLAGASPNKGDLQLPLRRAGQDELESSFSPVTKLPSDRTPLSACPAGYTPVFTPVESEKQSTAGGNTPAFGLHACTPTSEEDAALEPRGAPAKSGEGPA